MKPYVSKVKLQWRREGGLAGWCRCTRPWNWNGHREQAAAAAAAAAIDV